MRHRKRCRAARAQSRITSDALGPCILAVPGIPRGTGARVFDTVCVIGAGRAGSVLAARLEERGQRVRLSGRRLDAHGADLLLLAVPDRAIAEVARALSPGPWIA